jgi:hypothetical protein
VSAESMARRLVPLFEKVNRDNMSAHRAAAPAGWLLLVAPALAA